MTDWNNFKERLNNDTDYIANKELAKMIVSNETKAVHYYLTEIGLPIMKHIEFSIMHRDITAEYYIFLSSPYDNQEEKPLWHRVDLYKGINCLLSSYTSNIACRHFCKLANAANLKSWEKENPKVRWGCSGSRPASAPRSC